MFWLWAICALNLLISTWNAFVVGAAWQESKAVGGGMRAVVLAGWAMSALGFTSVYAAVVTGGLYHFEFIGDAQVQYLVSWWFVIIGPPLVAAAIMITVHSWAVAFREGGFLNYGVATYNTWATIHDARVLASGMGDALSNIGSYSSSGSGSGSGFELDEDGIKIVGVVALVAIVISVVVMGCVTTWLIVRYVSKRITAEERMPATIEEARARYGKGA